MKRRMNTNFAELQTLKEKARAQGVSVTNQMDRPTPNTMVDPKVFEDLKAKADEDAMVREELTARIKNLDRDLSYTQGLLTRIHSTPRAERECIYLQSACLSVHVLDHMPHEVQFCQHD